MIMFTRLGDENVNGSHIRSSDAATKISEDTEESLEPPPPDYNIITDKSQRICAYIAYKMGSQ